MKKHVRGPLVPEVGDSILESLEGMVGSAGVFTPAASIPAAKLILRQAETEGNPATSVAPFLFNILGSLWTSTGAKDEAGEHVLTPSMKLDWGQALNERGGTLTLNNNQYAKLCDVDLPVRPYPRIVLLIGTLWGKNGSGKALDVEVWANGAKGRARLGQWDEQVSAFSIGSIPAGVTPDASMWARGTVGGSSVVLSAGDEWSKLIAIAIPDFTA